MTDPGDVFGDVLSKVLDDMKQGRSVVDPLQMGQLTGTVKIS